jgi:hypothetical protein
MAIDFPNSPTTNQTYSSGGKTWRFDGTSWRLITTEVPVDVNYELSTTEYDGGAPDTILFYQMASIDAGGI